VVAVDCPGYWGIYSILQELNLKVLEIPVDHTHSIDLEALENAIRKADVKACLFMPNFSTPTGALMSDDKKNTLVKMLSAKNLPLIEDDVMGDIYFSKLRPRTCKSFDTRGNVMLCSSFSKTLGPGFRVGWCIPGKYKEEIVKVKKSHSLSSTTVMHSAIATFLEKGRFDLHMRKLRQAFQSNMLKYRDAILKYFPEDIGITLPHGGNSLWIQLNEKLDAFKLHHEAIKTGFCLIPGHVSNQNGRYTNYIRISYSMMYNQTIEKGLKTLGELVKSMAT
jgi:DNA-binding transcriptional MocR family regulator